MVVFTWQAFFLFILQAKLVSYDPLRTADVKLPSSVAFVVAHSGVEVNKAASSVFNMRVVECRIAAQVYTDTESQTV